GKTNASAAAVMIQWMAFMATSLFAGGGMPPAWRKDTPNLPLWRDQNDDEAALRRPVSYVSSAYSWLPGTGLNLMPRKATPTGALVVASMVIAVQMMLIEVAAIAVVP